MTKAAAAKTDASSVEVGAVEKFYKKDDGKVVTTMVALKTKAGKSKREEPIKKAAA